MIVYNGTSEKHRKTMTSIRARKSEVRAEHGGFESMLRNTYGLKDEVSLERIKDGGMHGAVIYVFDTPDGTVECGGYISQPPVATYSMRCTGEQSSKLFK